MAALAVGAAAPDFTLRTTDGKTLDLREALRRGPIVAAFFKTTCPTCQLALPYVERLHKAYAGKNVTVIGVSQNDKGDTKEFMSEYGLSLPVLLDDRSSYSVSNAYGLTNVPTLFYISRDGEVGKSIVGWSRAEMEEVEGRIAQATGAPKAHIFRAGEDVPEFKAG